MAVKHAFVSAKSDGGDATLVRPSNWNADHKGNALDGLVVAASNASTKAKDGADYVCDGTADEVEINAAIAALGSLGGRVLLTGGTFTLAAPILLNDHGLILEGVGWGDPVGWTEDGLGTTLQPAGGFTGSALIVAATGTFGTSNPVAACQVRQLFLDGAAGTSTPVGSNISGIQFSSFSGSVSDIRIAFMSGKGLWVSGKTTATTWSTYDSRINGILIHNCTLEGMYLDNFAEDLQIANVVIHHCKGDGCDDRGSSNQFLNCHFYDNGDGGGTDGAANANLFVASTVARSKFTNCKFEHAEGQYGVRNEGSETLFVGCSFHNNGETWGSPTTSAVTFQNAGDTVTQTDHRLLNGDRVQFSSLTTITDIAINTTYYVVNRTSNTFQLALTAGGSAIVFTSNGSGTLVRQPGGNARAQLALIGGQAIVQGCKFGIKSAAYTVGAAIEVAAASASNLIDGCSFQQSGIWANGPILDQGSSDLVIGVNHSGPGEQKIVTLASDHALTSTTATEVFQARALQPGTYRFEMFIRAQSATTTVSPMFGVNFTGTAAVRSFRLRYPSTGTTAITGVAEDVGATSGQIEESVAQTAFSTSAPNLGATGGVAAANADILYIIEGFLIVTAAGDLELWHGSETATSTTVKAGTSMIVTRVA